MLDRQAIIELLRENGQNPKVSRSKLFKSNTNTIIETDSKGVYYILQYNGDGSRVGWSLSHSKLAQIKNYGKNAILFLNSVDNEIFIILETNKEFYNFLNSKANKNKIDRQDVEKYKISYQNLEEYFAQ